MDYFYNSQKPIPMSLKKEGYVTLNGQEFPVEKMVYNPLAPIEYISGTFFMCPHSFPKPFSITVGCKKYERTLLVSRIPNNSVSTAAFESSKDAPFYVQYFIDSKDNKFTMNVSFNLSKAKSIRDIVESTTIYNAFLDGTGMLLGKPLESDLNTSDVKKFDDNSIIFWEKMLSIEELLGVSFVPPQDDVDFETMCLVEQFFQNLIKKVPTRDKQIINSIDGKWDSKSQEININKSVGEAIFFQFEATTTIELFGIKLSLPSLLGIFNAVLSEYSTKGKKQRIILSDESDEKKRFTSIMLFKNEEDLKIFQKTDYNEIISLFHKAKKPNEYL